MKLAENKVDGQFALDIKNGLGGETKRLPSVYFYDDIGSRLFDEICRLPEYYPTRTETEILQQFAPEIVGKFDADTLLVELGSGTSRKTRIIIEAFLEKFGKCNYTPIDVSEQILYQSAKTLAGKYKNLTVQPIAARYRQGMHQVNRNNYSKILLLWLGSSIGNFEPHEAVDFVRGINHDLRSTDGLLIGIDLEKSPEILEAAYNDASGVTAKFNLNLLERINREFSANFSIHNFRHIAEYNSRESRIEMYLESKIDQHVDIPNLNMQITFLKGERIHTENSCKYSLPAIEELAEQTNLQIWEQWFDRNKLFSLNLFKLRI